MMLVSIVTGLDVCQNYIKPNTPCEMVSPTISCVTYNYTITNSAGDYIENNTLSVLNSNFYYFNFTETSGQYVVRLCDGTTREIYVQPDSLEANMTSVAIIMALIGFAFWLIYTANTLSTRSDEGEIIYLNTLLKYICYAAAGFVAYVTIQLSYSFADFAAYNQGILGQLMATQNLIMWFGIIVLMLLFFGIFGNAAYNIVQNIGKWVNGRQRR